MHGDTKRVGGDASNWIQVLDGIVERSALEQGLVDVRLSSAEQDGVPIGLCARDSCGAERRAASSYVLNHHAADEGFHFVRPRARDEVESAARRKGNHKSDWPRRISLR